MRLSGWIALGCVGVAGCDSPTPPGGPDSQVPALADTIVLDRPDRSGRLYPSALTETWTHSKTALAVGFSPVGFAAASLVSDTAYPRYPDDPNAYRLDRADMGKGIVTIGDLQAVVIAPMAVDDTARLGAGVASIDLAVLANDRRYPGESQKKVVKIVNAGHGQVSVLANGQSLHYQRPPSFVGGDMFSYVVQSIPSGILDTARVRVFVTPGPYTKETLSPVGTSQSISDVADGRWVAGTATMADGSKRAVRWHNGSAEVLRMPPGAISSSAAMIAATAAVVGTIDGAAYYWPAGDTDPVAITGGPVISMNNRGDVLLRGADPAGSSCAVAMVWRPSGSRTYKRLVTNICGITPRAMNDSGDVIYSWEFGLRVSDSLGNERFSHNINPVPAITNTRTVWGLHRLMCTCGQKQYFGPVVATQTTHHLIGASFPGMEGISWVNDDGWLAVNTAAGPALISPDWSLFPVKLLGEGAVAANPTSVVKITNDYVLLVVDAAGKRTVLFPP